MKTIKILIFAVGIFVFYSCGNKNLPEKIVTDWKFAVQGTVEMPKSDIFLVVNSKEFEIATNIQGEFVKIDMPEFPSFDIPMTAITACQGTYMNMRYIYIVEKLENELVVKKATLNMVVGTALQMNFEEVKRIKSSEL